VTTDVLLVNKSQPIAENVIHIEAIHQLVTVVQDIMKQITKIVRNAHINALPALTQETVQHVKILLIEYQIIVIVWMDISIQELLNVILVLDTVLLVMMKLITVSLVIHLDKIIHLSVTVKSDRPK
jgi:hypothetical protein